AEGIDLPGEALIGVCIVGVGFPQIGPQRDAIRARADEEGRQGFDIAYRYPGMQKVLQAAGRLIRSEADKGVLLLCDDRYSQAGYKRLLPEHYEVQTVRFDGEIVPLLHKFWEASNDLG
ncbi:MAG: ATP-dependent DNA helicase, partial [Clostridiales bacterium]|nr:ATP-dependent DNA helicase [Clostridiales bacterium]